MTWSLAFPYALILLPAPFLVWWLAPPYRTRSKGIRIPFFREITTAAGLEPHEGAIVRRRGLFQMVAAILCWSLVVLGLARPELLGQQVAMEKAARDLMLAVDISGSMDARDMRGEDGTPKQRLEVVKDVVGEFIAARDGDRIGLIVFGTKAYVQTPFTEDLETVETLLDETLVGMAGPDTAIGDALGLAIRSFENSDVEQRLMVLLSDGADTSSRMSPVNAAEIAAQKGVTIYTIGVGNPSGGGDERVYLDALEDIAQRADGNFYFAEDGDGLSAIYGEIEKLNPRITETITFQPRQPLAWIAFATAAILAFLMIAGLSLSSRRGAG